MLYQLLYVAQMALAAQPDAKMANGLHWLGFWLKMAAIIIDRIAA